MKKEDDRKTALTKKDISDTFNEFFGKQIEPRFDRIQTYIQNQIESRFDKIDRKLEEHGKKFNDLLRHGPLLRNLLV